MRFCSRGSNVYILMLLWYWTFSFRFLPYEIPSANVTGNFEMLAAHNVKHYGFLDAIDQRPLSVGNRFSWDPPFLIVSTRRNWAHTFNSLRELPVKKFTLKLLTIFETIPEAGGFQAQLFRIRTPPIYRSPLLCFNRLLVGFCTYPELFFFSKYVELLLTQTQQWFYQHSQ